MLLDSLDIDLPAIITKIAVQSDFTCNQRSLSSFSQPLMMATLEKWSCQSVQLPSQLNV